MKLLKKCLVFFLTFVLVFGLAACAKNTKTTEYPADVYDGGHGGISYYATDASKAGSDAPEAEYGWVPDSGETPAPGKTSELDSEYRQSIRSGQITAAAWNENVNYDFWRSLFKKGQTEEENGKFVYIYEGDRWGFDSTNRVKVTVKVGETPVAGANVICLDNEGKARFAAVTGSDGVAYLFPEISSGTIKIASGEYTAELSFEAATCELEATLEGAEAKQETIKLMFLIDATGSMWDEIDYLITEIENVIKRAAAINGGVRIDLALLFYTDECEGDRLFTYYDFVNVNDPAEMALQLENLKKESNRANGGDEPEAADEALALAMEKNWGDENSTKIIFHLLDAPPHSDSYNPQKGYEKRFENAVRLAAEKGIRICPILCSGANELCEYLVRQEAIYTGGTFIFVTNHSGIGNAHLDPDIPDAVVEKLNDLMVRLIDGYYTGSFAEPVEWDADQKQQGQQTQEPTLDNTLEPDFVDETNP